MPSEVTAETITDEQIKELLRTSGPNAEVYNKFRMALDRRLSAKNRRIARHFAALHWNQRASKEG